MELHPRHRADCAEFFVAPDHDQLVDLQVPADVREELEHTASRTGRTFNHQLNYIINIYLGRHQPDFDDTRSVEDWCALLSACRYRLTEAEDWIPFERRQGSKDGA